MGTPPPPWAACSNVVWPLFQQRNFSYYSIKPSLMQIETIASCSIASYLGEEINLCLTTTIFQVAVETIKPPSASSSPH